MKITLPTRNKSTKIDKLLKESQMLFAQVREIVLRKLHNSDI
jgi:hypothetical protein